MKRPLKKFLYILLIHAYLLCIITKPASGLHLTGTFKTDEFFKFITRFGIQSTDEHNKIDTIGYIYGNITLIDSSDPEYARNPSNYKLPHNSLIMLTVLDYNYFIEYYNKRNLWPKSVACPLMFQNIKNVIRNTHSILF